MSVSNGHDPNYLNVVLAMQASQESEQDFLTFCSEAGLKPSLMFSKFYAVCVPPELADKKESFLIELRQRSYVDTADCVGIQPPIGCKPD